MSKKAARPVKKTLLRKAIPWMVVLVVAILFLILLPVGGFAFAASQEAHDPFCGSCHTQPESTFLQRSTAAQPVDLASYHSTESTRCIDCHSGQGLGGRLQAEMMGASNAVKWYSGTAQQPAHLTQAIGDEHCLKCHQQVSERGYVPKNKTLQEDGEDGEAENGHWHLFLTRWQSVSSKAAQCTSCHNGHADNGGGQVLYLNVADTRQVCDSCHQTLGRD